MVPVVTSVDLRYTSIRVPPNSPCHSFQALFFVPSTLAGMMRILLHDILKYPPNDINFDRECLDFCV